MKNNKKNNDIYSLLSAISIITSFILFIIATIYSISATKDKVVSIVLWVLFGISIAIFIFSIVKFALGNPKLKNK